MLHNRSVGLVHNKEYYFKLSYTILTFFGIKFMFLSFELLFFLMKNHISVPYVTVCQHYSQIMSNYDNIWSYPDIKLITRFLFEL